MPYAIRIHERCPNCGEDLAKWDPPEDQPPAPAEGLREALIAAVEALPTRDASIPFRDIHGQLVTYSEPPLVLSRSAVLVALAQTQKPMPDPLSAEGIIGRGMDLRQFAPQPAAPAERLDVPRVADECVGCLAESDEPHRSGCRYEPAELTP